MPSGAEAGPPRTPNRVAVIFTTGDPRTIAEMATTCMQLAREGAHVRVFFRDESIPALCVPAVAQRLGYRSVEAPADGDDGGTLRPASSEQPPEPTEAVLHLLANSGDVTLYACSSSLYLWGVTARDLLPVMSGARGLVAFLVEDLAGAERVLSY